MPYSRRPALIDDSQAAPDLPGNLPRHPLRFTSYRQVSAAVEAEVVRRLGLVDHQSCRPLFAVILSGWSAFLHRLTDQAELVLWLPCAVKASEEGGTEACKTRLSLFPVSSRFEARMTFKQHLSEIASQLAVRQAAGLETAGNVLLRKPDNDAPEAIPLLFSFEFARETSVEGQRTHGPWCAVSECLCEQTGCELALRVAERENGEVELRCDYAPKLFAEGAIQRWLRNFQTFLADVALDADRQLQEYQLLTVEERKQILYEWNDTSRDYPDDVCLHDLIEAQVRRTPDAVALVFEGESLTYDGLNRRANRLAHRLRRFGLGPERIGAVLAEGSIETIVGLVAVLKAGGAYLPLDPAYPRERLSLVLRDAQPGVVLAQRRWAQKLAGQNVPVFLLEDDFEGESEANPPSQTSPDNAAYVIYTSGSTGLPKGAVNIHRGICNYTIWWREYLQLTADDRFLQKVPLTFDPSVAEIFGALVSGAALVIARSDLSWDTRYLIDTICEQRVTAAFFVPSLLAVFVHDKSVAQCSSLRCVICGGEALSSELKNRFYNVLFGTELVNIYGPAEAVIAVSAWRCERQTGWRPVPIGRPIANTQLYILNPAMEPVPVGVAGELHIGGVQVARGYLGRPELTAKAFVPNPFGEGQLYKTGDLARYREDGAIEFAGRIDQQVKLRGQRIELGEIEAVLKRHRAVRDCVVVLRQEGGETHPRLVAYVAASGLSVQDLRRHAQQMLPGYMVPSAFVLLQELPVTAHGKLDRCALPEPVVVRDKKGSVPPRDALETQLVAIWENALRIEPIGVTDDFFELGGHSLTAARIFSKIKTMLGKNLPLATLFQTPTVEKLAAALREQGRKPGTSSLVAIQPRGSRPAFFCVHGGYGEVMFYSELARCLGEDQPFYGLQAAGPEGCEMRNTSIEAIASYYLQEIRQVQPRGPYFLGGYCAGGIIALEMAQQLHANREEVAFLVLFDATNPERPARHSTIRKRIRLVLEEASDLPPSEKPRYFARRIASRLKWDAAQVQEAGYNLLELLYKTRKPNGENNDEDRFPFKVPVWIALKRATEKYRPRGYPGRIVLFCPTASDGYEYSYDRGWNEVAQDGLEIQDIAGKHGTIFDPPHMPALAEKLDAYIRAALSSQARSEDLPVENLS